MGNAKKLLLKLAPYRVPTTVRKDKIKLDLNENAFGCSSRVIELLRNLNQEDVVCYPEYAEYQLLKNKIAIYLGIKPENILLTNGADDAIRCVMEAYIEKGDRVIMPTPSFATYEIWSKIKGAKIIEYLYNKNFSFPIKKLLRLLTKNTQMVIIISPNSVLGVSIKKDELIKVLKKATCSIVVLDETYYHFSNKTFVKLIRYFRNLVVIQTFSKAFGLAGLRLGFIISNEENIGVLEKVVLPYPVSSLAVRAGCVALEDKKFIKKVIIRNRIEKEFMFNSLKNLTNNVYMTDANFLYVNFGKWNDKIYQRLAENGILVRKIEYFPSTEGSLRITVGQHNQNLILLETLEKIIPPDAIIFDMDGVLVDVSTSYMLAIKKTAEYFLKKSISLKEIWEYKTKEGYNNDWDATQAILLSHGVNIDKKEIIDIFQQFYLGNKFDRLIKNEKLLLSRNTIQKLKKYYKLGIVTGRPFEEAYYTLRRFDITDLFDVVITMKDMKGKYKPDPYGIKLAIKKLNVKRAVYVGNSIDDIKSAIYAGVTPIGVISYNPYSRKIKKEFNKLGAKCIINSINDILGILA